MAVNFGPLAAEAGFCPGCEVCGEAFPYIPGGDEAAGRPLARVSGSVEVFEYLPPKVSGYQQAKSSRVADEVKVADLLGDDAQPRAGTESLYLWAEDLAESHILEVKGRFVGDGCADPLDPGGGSCRAGQRIRHHIRCTWQIPQLVGVFGDESQVALLAARGRRRNSVKGENQWLVIRPQLEGAALEPRAEVFYT
jgi:hypothetical protein